MDPKHGKITWPCEYARAEPATPRPTTIKSQTWGQGGVVVTDVHHIHEMYMSGPYKSSPERSGAPSVHTPLGPI